MQEKKLPTLKMVSATIDPDTVTEFKFTPQSQYLLIDIEAPEVKSNVVTAVARANCRVYEKMVQRYFAGDFNYDMTKLSPAETRTIKYLGSMRNAITNGSYLLTLIILEFPK